MLKSHNQKPSTNDEMLKFMMNILEQRYNQPCDCCCHQAATPVVQAQLPAIHVHCSGQDSVKTPTGEAIRVVGNI
ncbi:hypothetical protein FGIG_11571 [Fasciola gigantica]|uniref:Uncharacterized protein n=1 Tax=Fasciola gigantica TaxID=46835 RepID=A0A504YXQ6_FASGI|nr:hypothetical protein FGIG_11571 [Fasciola gigantica]